MHGTHKNPNGSRETPQYKIIIHVYLSITHCPSQKQAGHSLKFNSSIVSEMKSRQFAISAQGHERAFPLTMSIIRIVTASI